MPPGVAQYTSFSMYYSTQGCAGMGQVFLHMWVVEYRTSENVTLGEADKHLLLEVCALGGWVNRGSEGE